MKFVLLDYPSGVPGMALVLMRLSLAGLLACISLGWSLANPAISTSAAVLACLIAGGFLTRLASSLFAVAALLSIALGVISPSYAPLTLEGISLALLGPGAWSIDAWTLQSGVVMLPNRSLHDR